MDFILWMIALVIATGVAQASMDAGEITTALDLVTCMGVIFLILKSLTKK